MPDTPPADLIGAAWAAWLDLRTHPQARPQPYQAIPGQVWHGDPTRAVIDACGLRDSPNNVGINTGEAPAEAGAITDLLTRTGNLVRLGRDTVWVPDNWRTTDQDLQDQQDGDNDASGRPAAVPQDGKADTRGRPPGTRPGAKQPSPLVSRVWACEECAYTALTHMALTAHRRKLAGRPHPSGRYPCPLCPAVHTNRSKASDHIHRAHDFTGTVCWSCVQSFATTSEWQRHLAQRHPRHPRSRHPADQSKSEPSAEAATTGRRTLAVSDATADNTISSHGSTAEPGLVAQPVQSEVEYPQIKRIREEIAAIRDELAAITNILSTPGPTHSVNRQ